MSSGAHLPHRERGRELRIAGREDLAIREFERALALQPEDAGSLAELALCHAVLGDSARAIDSSRAALGIGPGDAFVHLAAGYALDQAKRPAESLPHVLEALRLQPAYADALRLLASVRWALGERDAALGAVDEAVRLDPDDAGSHQLRAFYLRQLGKLDDARDAVATALRLEPGGFWSHLEDARTARAAADWSRAADAYREALRLRPGNAECRAEIVTTFQMRNVFFRAASRAEDWFWSRSRWDRLALLIVTGGWLLPFAFLSDYVGGAGGSLSRSLSDTILRFDRLGRQFLTPPQIVASDRLLMLCAGLGGLAALIFIPRTVETVFLVPLGPMAIVAAALVPNCRPGTGRRRMAAYVTGAALIAVAPFALLWAAGTDQPSAWRVLAGLGFVPLPLACAYAYARAPDIACRFGYPWSHRFDLMPRPAPPQ